MKYVLVTGGVVSGLGKGVTASSIGLLLQACGLRVTSIKIGIELYLSDTHAHARTMICT
jgi:CTP synthase (UTP-ammonia lyase)